MDEEDDEEYTICLHGEGEEWWNCEICLAQWENDNVDVPDDY